MVNYAIAQSSSASQCEAPAMLSIRARTKMKAVLGALIPLRVNIATLVSVLLVLVAGAIVFE